MSLSFTFPTQTDRREATTDRRSGDDRRDATNVPRNGYAADDRRGWTAHKRYWIERREAERRAAS